MNSSNALTLNHYRSKVECAGLCLSLSECFAFEGFETTNDKTCNLIKEQDICIDSDLN